MKMHKLSPILWTKNLQETISFYENVLGFTSESYFPNFASLSRDNIEIMTIVPTEEPEDCRKENAGEFFPKPVLTGSIFIFMDNVDDFWERIKDQAVIKSSLADREYQMRDFSILDNNGYELVFGEDISAIRQ